MVSGVADVLSRTVDRVYAVKVRLDFVSVFHTVSISGSSLTVLDGDSLRTVRAPVGLVVHTLSPRLDAAHSIAPLHVLGLYSSQRLSPVPSLISVLFAIVLAASCRP